MCWCPAALAGNLSQPRSMSPIEKSESSPRSGVTVEKGNSRRDRAETFPLETATETRALWRRRRPSDLSPLFASYQLGQLEKTRCKDRGIRIYEMDG